MYSKVVFTLPQALAMSKPVEGKAANRDVIVPERAVAVQATLFDKLS